MTIISKKQTVNADDNEFMELISRLIETYEGDCHYALITNKQTGEDTGEMKIRSNCHEDNVTQMIKTISEALL